MAARIQESAAPNTVVISAATAHLLHSAFALEELGTRSFKGITEPMAVSRVVSLLEENSVEADAAPADARFLVGRDEELGLLRRRWQQSKEGLGQTVLINGEAGIGKTALSEALRDLVLQEGHMCVMFRCSPYHQNSPLYPILQHLEALFRFAPDESSDAKLAKIERLLGRYSFSLEEMVPLFAALLSVAVPEKRYAPLTLSPQQQRQRTHDALALWIVEEARRQPLLIIWEDVHQADPSTLELLGLAMDQAPTVRGLNLLTFRPEFLPPWTARSHMTPITLNRLERPQVEAMVTHLAGGKTLPTEVTHEIVSKTDGVPLYVEELTKMVLESDFLRVVDGHYKLTRSLPSLAIPTTLQDLLMARLDRWPEVREVAQLGAVFGREFAYEMLQTLTTVDEATLQERLAQLVDAELLYQRGRPPRAKYFFRHALIQDAAYTSLLRSVRQHYHQQIAQLFEKHFPDIIAAQPEGVAHHYTEAGLGEQAVPYWLQAGQQAVQRSANAEAVGHLTKGLEVLMTVPDTPERMQQELMLHVTRGAPLVATKGFADPEVEQAFTRLREICRQMGDPTHLFPILFRLRAYYMVRGELDTSRELGEQLLQLAEGEQDRGLLVEAQYALGATLFYQAEFAPAQERLQQAAALYDREQHSAHAFLYGQDPGVACLTTEALALWLRGYPDRAVKKSQEAIALAQDVSHPFSLAFAWAFASLFYQYRREAQACQERADAAISLSAEQGFPFWLALGTMLRGWALAEQGQEEEGVALIRRGMAAYQATGAELARTHFLSLLVDAHAKAGQIEEGLTALAEALDAAQKTGERVADAELQRLKGELTLQSGDDEEAQACFQKAIDIAREQEAKSWELRAATSLARLWQQQGKTIEARELLTPVYDWFTEGFDTADLKDAKALLDELS